MDRIGRFGSADRYGKMLLAKAVQQFAGSNCEKLLSAIGVTAKGLRDAGSNATFYDATSSSTAAKYTVGGVVGNTTGISEGVPTGRTLVSFGSPGTFAYTFKGENGNAVALYGDFYREGLTLEGTMALAEVLRDQQNTVLHEAIHMLDIGHDDLLAIGKGNGLSGLSDITAWLGRDCK